MRYPGPDSAVLAWYRARGAALSAKSLAIGQSGREYAFRCANRKCRRSGTREQALGKKGVVLERKNVFIRKVSGGAAIFRRVGRGRPRLLYFLTPLVALSRDDLDELPETLRHVPVSRGRNGQPPEEGRRSRSSQGEQWASAWSGWQRGKRREAACSSRRLS